MTRSKRVWSEKILKAAAQGLGPMKTDEFMGATFIDVQCPFRTDGKMLLARFCYFDRATPAALAIGLRSATLATATEGFKRQVEPSCLNVELRSQTRTTATSAISKGMYCLRLEALSSACEMICSNSGRCLSNATRHRQSDCDEWAWRGYAMYSCVDGANNLGISVDRTRGSGARFVMIEVID